MNTTTEHVHEPLKLRREPVTKPLYPSPCCGRETVWVARVDKTHDVRRCPQCGEEHVF